MNWLKIGKGCIKEAILSLRDIKVKALNEDINIQTNADIKSNKAIIDYLKKRSVKCNVFSEEEKEELNINGGDNDVVFVIDPIDNTLLFLRGEVSFCSVALMILINGFPKYAFIGDISNDDVYYCDEKYAYKNEIKMKVPKSVQGRNIILGWAPYKLRLTRLYESLKDLTEKDYYLYNFGGQLQAVKIALGSYDAYVEIRAETLNEFCAAVIVERAGGIVSKSNGKPIEYNPKKLQTLIIARNETIYRDILQKLKDKDYEN